MTQTQQPAPLNWLLLLWWIPATAAGFALASLFEVALGRSSGLMVVAFVAVGGTGAVALQWLALRRLISGAGWWTATGVAGAALAGLLGIAVGVPAAVATAVADGTETAVEAGLDAAGVTAAIVFGAALGSLQWLVLRRHVAGANRWILVSAVGWVVSGLSAGVTDTAAGWAVLGAVYGVITGVALVWLLRRRVDEE